MLTVLSEHHNGQSAAINEAIKLAYNHHVPPFTIGWVRIDRPGDITFGEDICDGCGQDLQPGDIWFAPMSDGSNYGPVCGGCATSE